MNSVISKNKEPPDKVKNYITIMDYKKLEDIQEMISSDILDSTPPIIYTIKDKTCENCKHVLKKRCWIEKSPKNLSFKIQEQQ